MEQLTVGAGFEKDIVQQVLLRLAPPGIRQLMVKADVVGLPWEGFTQGIARELFPTAARWMRWGSGYMQRVAVKIFRRRCGNSNDKTLWKRWTCNDQMTE